MRTRDDLIFAFRRSLPQRIAEATELWLGFEQGEGKNLATLRRLLHTVKGEAHMLELHSTSELAELAESLVDALRRAGQVTPLTGDAILGAFDGINLASADVGGEPAELEGLFRTLRAAIEELGQLAPKADESARQPATREDRAAGRAELREGPALLRAEEVRPLTDELRRLFGEQVVMQKRLRETQRMLRALLVEIDPRRGAESLLERITKTLGYGSEIDRQLSSIRADWSGNDFAIGLSLDEMDGLVRRASVVSGERLLNQVVRVGRSTARMLDKDVEVKVRGGAILDASVERRLEPALLHLVRNAIDHGIEPAASRRESGKPERGTVEVSIAQTESSVVVEVRDDGRGVNFDRLRAVLADRVPNAASLPNEELLPFLLEQGVTTSEQVTSISGRGVGLDVVAREIAAAGGQLRIESERGAGTRIVLNLPPTLRGEVAVPLLCGPHGYAVPTRAVHSIVRIEQIESTADGPCLRVPVGDHLELVRLFSLRAVLGQADEPKRGEPAVVLYRAAGLYALSVDRYDNPRPITVQRTEELAFSSALVQGVAPTPDGGVLLLLDVEALYGAARAPGRPASQRPSQRAPGQPRVLVVEDAPVARELLSRVLRALGLRVEEATDGRQGLALARAAPPDLILTDLEMPYMNGIEMIRELRRSKGLTGVPVIVLTTASNDENRAELSALGVVAQLSKQRFVEADLRAVIERCLKRAETPGTGS